MTTPDLGPLPTLHTERLTLRPFVLTDAPRVRALAGERAVADTTGSIAHPYEEGMAETWIGKHQKKFTAGKELQLAVAVTSTGELLGNVGLFLALPHRRAELGYWLGTPYWGSGYATEACAAMVRHGFDTLGLARIVAQHFQRNPASERVLRKLGMRPEGLLRQHYLKWDTLEDVVLHGLLRQDWEAARS